MRACINMKAVITGLLLATLLTLAPYHEVARAATLLPNGEQTFLDANGKPVASGCVYFYVPGTTTPKDTWVNARATASNTNPVVLDAAGRAIIYGIGTYRQVVKKAGPSPGSPCTPAGEQVWDQLTSDTSSSVVIFAGKSAGTPNAITVVASEFTGSDGQVINYISTSTNTGGATINPSGFGAVQIVRDSATGPNPLEGGELVATNAVSLIYDATAGVFHILSPVNWPNDAGVPVGTLITVMGFTAPTNFAFTYGQAVNRSTYPALLGQLTLVQTGSISSGSPTITGLTDTTQLGSGMAVEAIGISGGTTILSCTSSTCTMSANATTTRSGNMTFFPYGNGDGSLTFNLPDLRGRGTWGRDNIGGTAANVTQVTSTLDTTSASATATVGSAAGLALGMVVNSLNVPAGTTITAISGTTLTLSANASATALGTPSRFSLLPDAQVLGSRSAGKSTIAQMNLPNVSFNVSIPAGQGSHTHGVSGGTQIGNATGTSTAGSQGTPLSPGTISISSATLPAMTGTAASGGTGTLLPTLPTVLNVNYAIRLVP